MTTDALAPAAVMTRTWRVTPDRTDVVPTLRDYLRRLGASVEVGEAGAVEFATAEPDHEIDEWVAAWVETNEIVVRLDRKTYNPVLRQADLPVTHVPWWGGRTLRFDYE